ncbi:MAG TPA: hypothetical protein VF862_00795, partial [Gemmatimonadales bacterium]
MALLAITWGVDRTFSAERPKPKKLQQVTPADRKAAAKRATQKGLKPGVAGKARAKSAVATRGAEPVQAAAAPLPGIEGPGGVPHYFGPYGNWAYSPLPKGPVAAVTLVDPGTGYHNPLVYIDDAYGTSTISASVTATPDPASGAITGFTGLVGGENYTAPVVTIVDDPALCGEGDLPPCGTGATADAVIGGTLTGGMLKFVDLLPGIPGVTTYNTVANGYNADGSNNLGQYLSLAVKDTTRFPGS